MSRHEEATSHPPLGNSYGTGVGAISHISGCWAHNSSVKNETARKGWAQGEMESHSEGPCK